MDTNKKTIQNVSIAIKKINPAAFVPSIAYQNDAGCDIQACLDKDIVLKPHSRSMIPCGFGMALPNGWEAQIRPRSGNAINLGLTVLNSPGTIDSGYRGEIKIILYNTSDKDIIIYHGMKIAQMVIGQIPLIHFYETDTLPKSERGEKGFGSSNKIPGKISTYKIRDQTY